MSAPTLALPRQRTPGHAPLQHAPGCPPRPQLDGGTPTEDTSVVLVVGACHDCDALGPVVLIPCWETLTRTSGATRPIRGVDAALCHLCAGKRLADQGGVAW